MNRGIDRMLIHLLCIIEVNYNLFLFRVSQIIQTRLV